MSKQRIWASWKIAPQEYLGRVTARLLCPSSCGVIGTSFIYGLLKKSRPTRERERVDGGNASADIPFTKTNSNVQPVDRGDKGIVLILSGASRLWTNKRERSEERDGGRRARRERRQHFSGTRTRRSHNQSGGCWKEARAISPKDPGWFPLSQRVVRLTYIHVESRRGARIPSSENCTRAIVIRVLRIRLSRTVSGNISRAIGGDITRKRKMYSCERGWAANVGNKQRNVNWTRNWCRRNETCFCEDLM